MHPCPNHNNVRVSRAYGYQCIHAQTITNARVSRAYGYQCIHAQTRITIVFREHAVTSASMPKPIRARSARTDRRTVSSSAICSSMSSGTATKAKTPSLVQASSSADSFCRRPKVLKKEPLGNHSFPIAKALNTSKFNNRLKVFALCEKSP